MCRVRKEQAPQQHTALTKNMPLENSERCLGINLPVWIFLKTKIFCQISLFSSLTFSTNTGRCAGIKCLKNRITKTVSFWTYLHYSNLFKVLAPSHTSRRNFTRNQLFNARSFHTVTPQIETTAIPLCGHAAANSSKHLTRDLSKIVHSQVQQFQFRSKPCGSYEWHHGTIYRANHSIFEEDTGITKTKTAEV